MVTRLMTVAEFEQIAETNGDRRLELVYGEISEKMPTQLHACIITLLITALMNSLANSTRMMWLIYPKKQIVKVLTNTERQLLVAADTLNGGDVLPGFSLQIDRLFE